jgi:arylsulfatase A-like enzyme
VQRAIDAFRNYGVRLIRLHIQRIRDHWTGPEEKNRPDAHYQRYLLSVDHLLGNVVKVIRASGLWDSTFVIIAGDHGMGATKESDHPPSIVSSWQFVPGE